MLGNGKARDQASYMITEKSLCFCLTLLIKIKSWSSQRSSVFENDYQARADK